MSLEAHGDDPLGSARRVGLPGLRVRGEQRTTLDGTNRQALVANRRLLDAIGLESLSSRRGRSVLRTR